MATKRPRPSGEEPSSLLPGLPDDLAQLCLSLLPSPLLFSVCRSWRRLLYSPSFPPFLSLYAIQNSHAQVALHSFDPLKSQWAPLPPPPPHPPLLLRHPDFIARSLPVQSAAADGHLILLAATTGHLLPALPRPLVFHAPTARWLLGPPFLAPRRWCAAGSANGAVYVFSGVGSSYNADVARSAERWCPAEGGAVGWERLAALGSGRFSREAVEAVAAKGKICVVSVRGRAAKEGAVYDVGLDRWEEMPAGMLAGWTGPAASEEGEDGPIYVVDEESGVLRVYDWEGDRWAVVAEAEVMKGASQMAAGGGRVCVVCKGGAVVLVVAVKGKCKGRMWRVEPAEGKRVMAVHVLPRMPVVGE